MTQIDEQGGAPAEAEQAEGLAVRIARQLLEQAKAEGVSLVGPGGLLAGDRRTNAVPVRCVAELLHI